MKIILVWKSQLFPGPEVSLHLPGSQNPEVEIEIDQEAAEFLVGPKGQGAIVEQGVTKDQEAEGDQGVDLAHQEEEIMMMDTVCMLQVSLSMDTHDHFLWISFNTFKVQLDIKLTTTRQPFLFGI